VGGELLFGPEMSDEVASCYVDWTRKLPETMSSSILLMEYPDEPAVPEGLRGQHITHLRVAYSGDEHAEGFGLVEPLRRIGPRLADTVRLMPYTAVGSIHHDSTEEPVPAFDRNILLGKLDRRAAAVLSRYAGPRNRPPFLTELRAWGGALSRRPIVPNAIGGRHATFSLLAISDSAPENRCRRDELLEAMRPWSTGMTYPNFNGVEDTSVDAVRRSYRPEDFTRLQRIKAMYDPRNLFRVNFNITPEGSPE
jgi:hypothetical protein